METGRNAMRQYSRVTYTVLFSLFAAHAVVGQVPGGLKEQLDAVVKAQTEVHERFARGLEGETTAEAQKPVIERYRREVTKNTNKVLDLVRASPTEPAVVEALNFVIKTARAGPGDESYRAMEILLRDHVRDPGMGDLCGGLFYFVHTPVAESLLRSVLEKHPSRYDRGQACHAL